jgi:hypothetical protein
VPGKGQGCRGWCCRWRRRRRAQHQLPKQPRADHQVGGGACVRRPATDLQQCAGSCMDVRRRGRCRARQRTHLVSFTPSVCAPPRTPTDTPLRPCTKHAHQAQEHAGGGQASGAGHGGTRGATEQRHAKPRLASVPPVPPHHRGHTDAGGRVDRVLLRSRFVCVSCGARARTHPVPANPHACTHHACNTTNLAQGRAVIVVEVTRPSPATTPEQLGQLAKAAIACGADALCVRLDSEDTPQGTQDLFAVVQVRWQACLGGGGEDGGVTSGCGGSCGSCPPTLRVDVSSSTARAAPGRWCTALSGHAPTPPRTTTRHTRVQHQQHTVLQAAKRVPVVARDWVIHPLQLVEAKEAGAAGVLGVVGQVRSHGASVAHHSTRLGAWRRCGRALPHVLARRLMRACVCVCVRVCRVVCGCLQVNGRGTAVLSSFGAALGLDCPVEVVNARVRCLPDGASFVSSGGAVWGVESCTGGWPHLLPRALPWWRRRPDTHAHTPRACARRRWKAWGALVLCSSASI